MDKVDGEKEVVAVKLKNQNFVSTPYIRELTNKAIRYLNAGYPVHLRGPAGTGKTTLAMHIASCFEAPTVIMYGNDEYLPSDLIGSESGYRREKVVDNFIHTVMKTVDNYQKKWVDNQLTVAIKNGFSLIYDEFARSRPETNNVLLSILEEKMLGVSSSMSDEKYIKVHPDFKAIFTSNSDEYVGVHKVQDALLDRMITIDMTYMDAETERDIVMTRAGIPYEEANNIVNLVREMRESEVCVLPPSLRATIMLGEILRENNARAVKEDQFFRKLAFDILGSKIRVRARVSPLKAYQEKEKLLNEFIEKCC